MTRVASGECRFRSAVAFTARPEHSRLVMPAFRALRRLPQRRPVAVRGVLLFVLAIMIFVSMPKWIEHGHDDAHQTASSLAVGVPDKHHHDVADEPIVPLPDGSHVHAHYVAGAAATLPATLVGVCQPSAPGDACPPWLDVSTSDGALTRLHRPPIV